MSHDLKVHLEINGENIEITCDDVKEGEHGLTLIDTEGMNSKIGYVPYERLQYVRPNRE